MSLEKDLIAVFVNSAAKPQLFPYVVSGLWAVNYVWNVGWQMSLVVPCAVSVGKSLRD